MNQKIVSRIFQHGNKKESSWPPDLGSRESGLFYWDKEAKKFIAGIPPVQHTVYEKAPFIICDSMEPYRHPGTGTIVDSKSKLRMIDEVCGTITTDKKIAPDPSWQKEQERLRRKDAHDALHKAVAMVDAGTAPLSEETRILCAQTNDKISKSLGMDAFNAVGRITDARGKRFKRRKQGPK